MLKQLQNQNPNLTIKSVLDSSFRRYGTVLNSTSFSTYFDYLENHTNMPEQGNYYLAHDLNTPKDLMQLDAINHVYGGLELQFGYVNGFNSKLNALEYHKSSEINVCLTPLVLILARTSDLNDESKIDSSLTEIYYVPERTVIEIFSQTLHFSPCKVSDQGFKCGVILPMGTNQAFVKAKTFDIPENKLLFKTNKWLVAHKEHQTFINLGAYEGITGKNLEIKY